MFWWEKEGVKLPLDKIEDTKISQMVAFCEKYAHKQSEKIGKYIKNRTQDCLSCGQKFEAKKNRKFCSRFCFGKSHSISWEEKRKDKTLYGVNIKDLHEYREQNDKCEICGKEESVKKRRLAFDHDHNTGNFRGMLCFSCNTRYDWYLKNENNIIIYSQKPAPIV